MKLIHAIVAGTIVAMPAFADDAAPGVVERTDCAALRTQIENLDPADTDTAAELNAKYRRDCATRASGRRNAGRVASMTAAAAAPAARVTNDATGAIIDEFMARRAENCATLAEKIDAATGDDKTRLQKTHDDYCGDGPDAAPVIDAETAAKNIDKGLCADGSAPNKFGCCTDEMFKDLGNGEFGCCPKSGGDCFPPMK